MLNWVCLLFCADHFSNSANTKVCEINNIPDGWQGMDLTEIFNKAIMSSKQFYERSCCFEMEVFQGPFLLVRVFQNTDNGSFFGWRSSVAAVKFV